MSTAQVYEMIGYIASLLVALSLMMRSILKLRVINLIGSVFFTAYGLLIQAYPVAAVNFFIVLINLYYLYQMFSTREFFRLLEVRSDSEYLHAFLAFHKEDIQRFLPGFTFDLEKNALIFFILRDMVPAGLVIGEFRDAQRLFIELDYAIPGYRDLKLGRFIYRQHAEAFLSHGVRQVLARPGAPAHARYLQQMGFEPEPGPNGQTQYCLTLKE